MALSVKQGDTLYIEGVRVDEDGDPVSITGSTIYSQLRLGTIAYDLTCSVLSGANGTYSLSAPASETVDWSPRVYNFDVEFNASDGTVSSTATVPFTVEPDNTRS